MAIFYVLFFRFEPINPAELTYDTNHDKPKPRVRSPRPRDSTSKNHVPLDLSPLVEGKDVSINDMSKGIKSTDKAVFPYIEPDPKMTRPRVAKHHRSLRNHVDEPFDTYRKSQDSVEVGDGLNNLMIACQQGLDYRISRVLQKRVRTFIS